MKIESYKRAKDLLIGDKVLTDAPDRPEVEIIGDAMSAVRGSSVNIVAYRCNQCYSVVNAIWENTCNSCRKKNEQHEELTDEIRKLREEISALKSNAVHTDFTNKQTE